jgi:hypothetical protein
VHAVNQAFDGRHVIALADRAHGALYVGAHTRTRHPPCAGDLGARRHRNDRVAIELSVPTSAFVLVRGDGALPPIA